MDRQKVLDEWMRAIDHEVAHRAKEKQKQISAASTKLIEQLKEMGERLLARPDIGPMVDELMSVNGDRGQIEIMCARRDMSHAEACAVILMFDAKAAVRLLNAYGAEAAKAMRAVHR